MSYLIDAVFFISIGIAIGIKWERGIWHERIHRGIISKLKDII